MKRGIASFASAAALIGVMLAIAALTGCSSKKNGEVPALVPPAPDLPASPSPMIRCSIPLTDNDMSGPYITSPSSIEVFNVGVGKKVKVEFETWYFYRAAGELGCPWLPHYVGPQNVCGECSIPVPPIAPQPECRWEPDHSRCDPV